MISIGFCPNCNQTADKDKQITMLVRVIVILINIILYFSVFLHSERTKIIMEMQKIDTISVEIEPCNDQSIADNEDSKSGGDTIDHSDEMKVIIFKIR